MITAFVLLEEEIVCRTGGVPQAQAPVLSQDEKDPFLFFSVFLIKAFLSSNMKRILQKVPQ